MDAIELLKKDHDRVEELFARFRGGNGLTGLVNRITGNVSSRQRHAAVAAICRELTVHTRMEEEIFYPAVRAIGDAKLGSLIGESLREHAKVKEQVATLEKGGHEGDDLDSRVSTLEQDVQHHVSEEEGEMFPRVETLMPMEQRTELGRRLQARKRALTSGAGGKRRAASGKGRRTGSRRRTRRTRKPAVAPRSKRAAARKRARARSAR